MLFWIFLDLIYAVKVNTELRHMIDRKFNSSLERHL